MAEGFVDSEPPTGLSYTEAAAAALESVQLACDDLAACRQ